MVGVATDAGVREGEVVAGLDEDGVAGFGVGAGEVVEVDSAGWCGERCLHWIGLDGFGWEVSWVEYSVGSCFEEEWMVGKDFLSNESKGRV